MRSLSVGLALALMCVFTSFSFFGAAYILARAAMLGNGDGAFLEAVLGVLLTYAGFVILHYFVFGEE